MEKWTAPILVAIMTMGWMNCTGGERVRYLGSLENVPVFDSTKAAIIRENYCRIFQHVDKPESWYLKELLEQPDGYVVRLCPLVFLQGGCYKGNRNHYLFVHGQVVELLFSKQWDLKNTHVEE